MLSIFRRLSPWIVLAALVYLLILDFSEIDGRLLSGDSIQNLRSALNLLHHGTYSEASLGENVLPGYRREPVPNFLLGFYLGFIANIFAGFSYLDVPVDSTLIMTSKWINLGYAAFLLLSVWFLIRRLVKPPLFADGLSLLLFALINHFFIIEQLNTLNTELPAALYFIWLSLALVLTEQSLRWSWVGVSGVCLGLLILTKASGSYIGLLAIPVLVFYMAQKSRQFFKVLALFSLGFVCVVLPWIFRNYHEFDRPVVAQGAGDILLIRSSFNTMNAQEFSRAFYAYAPRTMREDLLGPVMELSDQDFSCGQNLDRFNRKLACDKKALKEQRYEDVRSFYQIGKRALPLSLGLERKDKQAEAISRILASPIQHVFVSLPMAWRGLWSFGNKISVAALVLNALSYFCLFAAPIVGIIQRRPIWIYLSLMPVGYFLFYAAFSHFLPRYSEPLIPSALICFCLMATDCLTRLFPRSNVRLTF